MTRTRIPFAWPRQVLYLALGIVLACTDEPTEPQEFSGPEFTKITNTDPTRVLTVGVDAPKNLTLKGTVAGIVVVVDNAIVDLSKATVDCSGQATLDPKIGVWIKNSRRNVHIKGGGTGVIKNCGIGLLIGPLLPGSGEPGGSSNHVDGLGIQDCTQAILVSNSHDNLIKSNRLVCHNGLSMIGDDPRASVSGGNKVDGNTITAGARFSIYVSSDANTVRGNVMRGEAVDAAIAVDRDANTISDNQTDFGPEGDDPMVGIQLLSGADGNSVTKNQIQAGDVGVLVEANTFRNTIRGNTALARSGRDAIDQSGNCINNSWKNNTFRRSDPACILGATLDAVTFTSPTTIQIEGSSATFNATITNQATKLNDVSIRSWIVQGVSRRLGGISPLRCTTAPGALPRGTCTQSGDMVSPSNATAGQGALAAGSATVVVELIRLVDGDTIVVDSRSVPIMLTAVAGSFNTNAVLSNDLVIEGSPVTYVVDFGTNFSSMTEVDYLFTFGNDPLDPGECLEFTGEFMGGFGVCNAGMTPQTSKPLTFPCSLFPDLCDGFRDGVNAGQMTASRFAGSGTASARITSATVTAHGTVAVSN